MLKSQVKFLFEHWYESFLLDLLSQFSSLTASILTLLVQKSLPCLHHDFVGDLRFQDVFDLQKEIEIVI